MQRWYPSLPFASPSSKRRACGSRHDRFARRAPLAGGPSPFSAGHAAVRMTRRRLSGLAGWCAVGIGVEVEWLGGLCAGWPMTGVRRVSDPTNGAAELVRRRLGTRWLAEEGVLAGRDLYLGYGDVAMEVRLGILSSKLERLGEYRQSRLPVAEIGFCIDQGERLHGGFFRGLPAPFALLRLRNTRRDRVVSAGDVWARALDLVRLRGDVRLRDGDLRVSRMSRPSTNPVEVAFDPAGWFSVGEIEFRKARGSWSVRTARDDRRRPAQCPTLLVCPSIRNTDRVHVRYGLVANLCAVALEGFGGQGESLASIPIA